MKSTLFAAIALIVLSIVSCKSRDKCSTCPTFSELGKIGQKQV